MSKEYARSKDDISTLAAESPTINAPAENKIKIPIYSFTAFRLMHGAAEEVSHVSQVVLLGSIPKLWFGQHKLGIIAKLTDKSIGGSIKSNVKHSIYKGSSMSLKDRGRLYRLRRLLREQYETSTSDEEEEDESEDHEGEQKAAIDNISVDNQFSLLHTNDQMDTGITNDQFTNSNVRVYSGEPLSVSFTPQPAVMEPPKADQSVPTVTISQPAAIDSTPRISDDYSAITGSGSSVSYFTAQESAPKSPSLEYDNDDKSASEPIDTLKVTFNSDEHPRIQKRRSSSQSTILYDSSQSTVETPIATDSDPTQKIQQPVNDSQGEIHSIASSARYSNSLLQRPPEPEKNFLLQPINSKEEQRLEDIRMLKHRKTVKFLNDPKVLKRKKVFHLLAKHYVVGEIIKSQRMLVMVKMSYQPDPSKLPSNVELENSDTRVYERWKEYIVVAKSSGDMDAPVRLEFLSHEKELKSGHKPTNIDFNLDKSCLISFYSSLDKTILIGHRNRLYVFSCQSSTTAIGWLTFLKETQGYGLTDSLRIGIPDLEISINLNIPIESLRDVCKNPDPEVTITCQPGGGYKTSNSRLVTFMSEKIRKRLDEAGYSHISKQFENSENLLGICWRHYDRLEWLYGESLTRLFWQHSMKDTHSLELRKVCHYPETLDSGPSDPVVCEPPPVEGFLSRMTTRSGNQRRGIFHKQVFKFSYLFTSNNLLFLTNAYKAIPPIVYSDEMMKDMDGYLSSAENFEKVRNATPQIYYHNPFQFDDTGHFPWLRPGVTKEEFDSRDLYAQSEFERKLAIILRSEAVLNLTEVENVTVFDASKIPKAADLTNNLVWDKLDKSKMLPFEVHSEDREIFFQIIMKNGTKMVLMAPNSIVRDEWIDRLLALSHYWTQRINQDMLKIKRLKDSNIKVLDIDDWMEANINEYTEKWENMRGLTSPEIHNISSSALFRSMVRNGELYQKLKKHSSFTKKFVLLVPGQLMVYDIFARSMTGRSIGSAFSTHSFTIPLRKCYVFSGNLTGLDLLTERESELEIHPGTNSTPRIYSDGWLSSDEEENVCFTLWFGRKRSISGAAPAEMTDVEYDENNNEVLRSNMDKDSSKNPGLFKMVGRLGVTGKSMVFKCRSRQERDLWVKDLMTELDRFEVHNMQ
ncbi:hypothetical protein WICPIJ_001710 [Wickerhamomyces pijperi]|uniref:PH domain-containing protein n=1 Tax=Wickerhamomyces pijperi TaxID=599730 RepID=A0A9P8QA96_WICPI|nr:hypothetical protein WICPIJ_001710 [Wickerhamomyces pijperi]